MAAFSWSWLIREVQQPLVLFGFAAQAVFFLRFVVQWFVSERLGRSHIPVSFWYLSLAGGLMTFVYALLKQDLVFMTSQMLAVFIYVRNLMLIYRPRKLAGFPARDAPASASRTPLGPGGPADSGSSNPPRLGRR